ncbi:ATP-binding protein [Streptomyces sp. NPDC050738]|uniref:ATP-binding protein n=1 Tax=Streptomyces sp. NPDC050738 TaxID=3154744 RepID=UPI00342A1F6E
MNHATGVQETDVDPAYRAELAVSEHSVRHLRRILRLYLTGWELTELADAAELALTELVANVVRHVPGRRCSVLILREGDRVRVEVADRCPRLPSPADGGELAEGGRGLLIIAAVADDWGVNPSPDGTGKTVWFTCGSHGGT